MTIRRIAVLFAIVALAALPVLAKPNFSGDWKLNVAKSQFGDWPAPSSMTNKIAHDDPKLKNSIKQSGDQGDFEMETNYTTDGKECTNELFGSPMESVLKWEGDTLVIGTKGTFGDSEFTSNEKWTLSADGKMVTITRVFKSQMGEVTQKLVLDKQ
jgi:hypothetical protein